MTLRSRRTVHDYYLLGRSKFLLFTPEGYAEAIKWHRKAFTKDVTYALAYAGLAETWAFWGYHQMQQGKPWRIKFKQAYYASEKAIELNPNLPEAHRAFGTALHFLDKSGYQAALQKALELNPNDAETWYTLWWLSNNNDNPDHEYLLNSVRLNSTLIVSRIARGNALHNLGRHTEAIAEYQYVLQITPNYSYAHNDMGVCLWDLGCHEEAIAEYKQSLSLNPNNAWCHYNLGSALYFLQHYEESVVEFKQALLLNSRFAMCHNNLGLALSTMKRYEEAIAEYKRAIRLHSFDATYYYNLGISLSRLERYEEAIKEYLKAIQLNPNYMHAYKDLALALHKSERHEEAIANYRAALGINSEFLDAHLGLGNVLNDLQCFDGAVDEYQEVIRRDPRNAKAHFNLGTVFAKQGKTREAVQHLELYLEYTPHASDTAEVQKYIQDLLKEL